MSGAETVRQAASVLPAEPGVYRFRDVAGWVIYVGRATELRSRVRSYAGDLADRRHLRRMVPHLARVEAVVCASVAEAAWLERNLLERSLPRWNRIAGGMELVGWLVVDDQPGRPGLHLSVETEPPSAFGPYLGVERLALARSGLLRVWPLHLTGTALGVAQRSLAEARSVLPSDRDGYARSLRAVLERNPDAVLALRARLELLTGEAAARLAFETAQQIQAELVAIDWLVATQRVTGCAPDLAVTGWADGISFTLSGTGGRLDRWTCRPVAEAAGREAAERTPPEWRDFAARNAQLAAALAAR